MKSVCASALPTVLLLALSVPLSSALPAPANPPTRSNEGTGPLAKNPVPDSLKGKPAAAAGARPAAVSAQSASAVPVGQVITSCTVPGTFAITFDDGPYIYTQSVLDTLKNNGVTATFFVNGQNWGDIMSEDSQASVKRAVAEGHQIGSHTYNHADLATLDHDGIVNQMTSLDNALKQILGYAPTYMRPPYLSTNQLVLQTLGELGYHVIQVDIDTKDYENDSEAGIQTAVNNFRDGLAAGGTLELSHDVHEWTAKVLVQSMIDQVKEKGLRAVPVGECLGDPKENWYRT